MCGMWETNVYGNIDTNERSCTVQYVFVTYCLSYGTYLAGTGGTFTSISRGGLGICFCCTIYCL